MKTTKLTLRQIPTAALVMGVILVLAATPAYSQSPDSFNPDASGYVYTTAVQPDGKVIVGGSFSKIAGQPRAYIGRLNTDGTVDPVFNPGASYDVYCLTVQADGKILVAGRFTRLGGQSRANLGRLNADGSLDTTFDPGASSDVNCLAVQADGKILVGGNFTTLGGQSRANLGRLNADGSLDTTFNPGASGYEVNCLAVQADGKILVGGNFTTLGGQSRANLGRLNADGTLDSTFNPGADMVVYSLAVQADGKILVGGEFRTLGGQSCTNLGRLNADGSLDTTFNPGASGYVNCLAVQTDGKILLGGGFTTLGGQARTSLGRLQPDGSVDATFSAGAGGDAHTFPLVYSLTVQPDGKVLVGGNFTKLGGEPRNNLGRLNNTEPATQSLALNGTTLTWLRGGSGPEVWRTTFDFSTNGGTTWTSLGQGVRISGGWQLTGINAANDASLRARGFASGGYCNGSGWFAEKTVGPAAFSGQPISQTNNAETVASFSVVAGGTEPLSFQWLKNGATLVDGGNTTGATTPTLTLNNVLKPDEGGYSVVVSNAYGSATSLVASLMVLDPCITGQPTGISLHMGQTAVFNVEAAGTEPLVFQWLKGGAPLPGQTASTLTLTNVQGDDAADYSVRVSNVFGSITSAVAVLKVNLAASDSFNPGIYNDVYALAVQPDGKVLAGGRSGILCRINTDGTPDASFNSGAKGDVHSIVMQPDGRILVAGKFSTLGGLGCTNIGRLESDGTRDPAFNSGGMGQWALYSPVYCLALQPDGKILVGGSFSTLGGQTRNNIGRLGTNGTLEASFNPDASSSVYSLALQPDGKILVGGAFSTLGGQSRNRIARLNANGTLDTTFNPGANGDVNSLALQPDGKILVGGDFTSLGGQSRNRLGRLDANGSLDQTFNPGASNIYGGTIYSLVVQADGKILVGGDFTSLGGLARTNIGRLNADGSVDPVFNPGADSCVYSVAVQADGKTLVGGAFRTLAGKSGSCLGRLLATDPATQSLSFEGSTLTWLRGGTSPEVWRTVLEVSTNGGANWTSLGTTARILGGWQLTGVSLPGNASLRARGFTSGGRYNGSGWFVETIGGAPAITGQPVSQTNNAGTTVSFTVAVSGTAPMDYYWCKDGIRLSEGGSVSGVTTLTLTLSNVRKADAGGYSVVVSNAFGSTTSLPAALTVRDPFIVTQPADTSAEVGQGASFSVEAGGTPPLSYQWFRGGMPLAGATTSVLTLTNVAGTDAGDYCVEVSNVFGSVTNLVAVLTVNDSFNVPVSYPVYAMALQTDGKVVVAGRFYTLGGQPRNYIGRLSSDGSVDSVFNPQANDEVYCLGVQRDGKIVVGGRFTTVGGVACHGIGRLISNGSADATFTAATSLSGWPGSVNAVALQADDKILVAGDFWQLNGQSRSYIGRLKADGSLDTDFNPGADLEVFCLTIQPDGRILVGGRFTRLGGQTRNRIGRLNANGTLDTAFNPGADDVVYSLAVQPDGKILVGGNFTSLGGQARNRIARLNPNGTLDTTFDPGADDQVNCLLAQADGKMLVGGWFRMLGGQSRIGIARLNVDGSVDSSFNPGNSETGGADSLALQADGRILVGTWSSIRRIFNTDPVTQTLALNGTTLTWLRGGASPEVWRTLFEVSTNSGASWADLGSGVRIAEGWQLSGVSAPASATLRARGFLTGGRYNASGWFVETIAGAPIVLTQPLSRTNNAGTAASFSVLGDASTAGYQWRKDGVNLTDGGIVSGATNAMLVLSNVAWADAGGYSVVLSNPFGSVTSLVAILTVVDPFIITQPASASANPGQSATLSVAAGGTAPLSYQWFRGDLPLPGATGASLTLTSLQRADAGNYCVVVGNKYGSITTAFATLNVNLVAADSFNPGANAGVNAIAVQTDGKILVGGEFTTLGGQARTNLARLNTDGTVDASFSPGVSMWGGASSEMYCLVVQPDSQIVVGGHFSTLAGQSRAYVGQLNADGSAGLGFAAGANSSVVALAQQADGRTLVGGEFSFIGGENHVGYGRFNADGSLDSAFNRDPLTFPSDYVLSLAVQGDGKILMGGRFQRVGTQYRDYIARLNTDGTVDTAFNPGAGWWVHCLAVQPDGRILVGGVFDTLCGQACARLGRLNPDGSLDTTFNPGANDAVWSLALQADGRILVAGSFTTLGGQVRASIGRLNADGSVDPLFNPGADGRVTCLAVQPDGSILVGGDFTALGGQTRNRIARLINTEPATQTLTRNGSTLSWLRGGTSPEVWCTVFEVSTNGGASWASLGAGIRIPGGWELTDVNVPTNASIRARGFATGGLFNGSGYFVETILGSSVVPQPPYILADDASFGMRSNRFGFNYTGTAGQSLIVEGSTNLSTWMPLQTNTIGNEPLYFSDPSTGVFTWRFYRVRTAP
jgi:uncharacterized delta-60 repeat protein